MKKIQISALFFVLLFACSMPGKAQELRCQVTVNGDQVQNFDQKIFQSMQKSISEFMNTTKWTDDSYLNQERIECNLVVVVTEASNTEFKGQIVVQSSRPIYKSSYSSPLFRYNDDDVRFEYTDMQAIQFNENRFTDNLSSMLAYYAYIVIGLDYDSFSLMGGTPYIQKAFNIVNIAQNSGYTGWTTGSNLQNRYWLTNNLTNTVYHPIREAIYQYHRVGLDLMYDDAQKGREGVTNALFSIQKSYRDRPGSMLQRIYMAAKADEIASIFSKALPFEKGKILPVVNEIDPINASKYARISQ